MATNTLVSARIVNHKPSAVRPFDEVKTGVRQLWVQSQSAKLATAEGQAQLATWKTDPSQARFAAALTVSREQSQNQPQALLDAALRADPKQLPALVGVDLADQGFAVVKVIKILPRPEAAAQIAEQSRQQFARPWGQAQSLAYLASLKSEFKVEILAEKPKKLGTP